MIEQRESSADHGGGAEKVLGVELRHLSALAAIADEGSFWGAAERLGYVQSAVSSQLARLERVVGVRLVERTRGRAPVALTDAGRVLLEHAEVVLTRLNAARAELAEVADAGPRSLRVGAFEAAARRLLPRILPEFAGSCPEVRVERLETQHDAPLFGLLQRDEIDLALCELPVAEGEFESVELIEDPFVLIVGAGSSLAGRSGPPSPSELDGLPLIGCDVSRTSERAREALASHGVDAEPQFRSDHTPTVEALVGAGVGVAVVPSLAVDPRRADTEMVEVPGLPARTVALVWSGERARSRPAELFAQGARAACAVPVPPPGA